MGFNTIHLNGRSLAQGYNKTQEQYFKFRTIDREQAYRTSLSGVSLDKSKLVIAIDGNASVAIDDQIEVFGNTYIVTEYQNDINNLVSKKRKDLDNVRSGLVVTLE